LQTDRTDKLTDRQRKRKITESTKITEIARLAELTDWQLPTDVPHVFAMRWSCGVLKPT